MAATLGVPISVLLSQRIELILVHSNNWLPTLVWLWPANIALPNGAMAPRWCFNNNPPCMSVCPPGSLGRGAASFTMYSWVRVFLRVFMTSHREGLQAALGYKPASAASCFRLLPPAAPSYWRIICYHLLGQSMRRWWLEMSSSSSYHRIHQPLVNKATPPHSHVFFSKVWDHLI